MTQYQQILIALISHSYMNIFFFLFKLQQNQSKALQTVLPLGSSGGTYSKQI